MAGYSENSRQRHLNYFSRLILPNVRLRAGKSSPSTVWKSFMTDDFTPFEFSWSWKPGQRLPSVRYSVELIGDQAGTSTDLFNTQTTVEFLEYMQHLDPVLKLGWHHHFLQTLLAPKANYSKLTDTKKSYHSSQIFLGFDLCERVTTKVYYVPTWRALAEGRTCFDVTRDSISTLSTRSPRLKTAFEILSTYISSLPSSHRPEVEMVATDCIEPSKARIKIYIRSRQTSLADVHDTMTLGGRIEPMAPSVRESMEMLWRFALEESSLQLDHSLPEVRHRTSGILYYFELGEDKSAPVPKVYLPVKHYGKNDQAITEGISRFLESRGQGLLYTTYLGGVKMLR